MTAVKDKKAQEASAQALFADPPTAIPETFDIKTMGLVTLHS